MANKDKQLLRTFFNKEKCFENFLINFNYKKQISARKNVFWEDAPIYEINSYIDAFLNNKLFRRSYVTPITSFFCYSFIWTLTKEGGDYWLNIGTKWQKYYEKNTSQQIKEMVETTKL